MSESLIANINNNHCCCCDKSNKNCYNDHHSCNCSESSKHCYEKAKEFNIITDESVLRKKCENITSENQKLAIECIDKLKHILSSLDHAVGLAAPQLGYNLKIFCMKYNNDILVVVNPVILKIIKPTKYLATSYEGCLSIPNKSYITIRHTKIQVRFQDENFKWQEKTFKNFDAYIFQHEYDHINGVLIKDHGEEIVFENENKIDTKEEKNLEQ